MPLDEGESWLSAGAGLSAEAPARGPSRLASAPPVSWRIVNRCVLLESNEMATVDDWSAAIGEAVADQAFEPGMSVVHDTRRRLGAPEPNEVRDGVRVVASLARASTIRRWATVARPGAHFGMARMAQILSELGRSPRAELRAFQDLAEAFAWAAGAPAGAAGHGSLADRSHNHPTQPERG